jgi:hypothetical protein
MTGTEILGLFVVILTLIGGLELRVQRLVKQYLKELAPNSGTSMKDQINRLEARQFEILTKLIEK